MAAPEALVCRQSCRGCPHPRGDDPPQRLQPRSAARGSGGAGGGHLLPAWHLPRCPPSSPARLTLRSGARLMTGLIDLCRGSAPRREIDAGTRSRLCKKPFLPPAQPGSAAPRPRGSAHRSGQGSIGDGEEDGGEGGHPRRGGPGQALLARGPTPRHRGRSQRPCPGPGSPSDGVPPIFPNLLPAAGGRPAPPARGRACATADGNQHGQRRPREPAAHTRSNSRNRPSRSAPRFAGFAHRGSIAPQKSLGQPLCAAGAKRCSRHDPSGAAAARPGTRRQPEGWESRARPGTALPTPVPSLAAARHLRPLPPPAPLRHSPAPPASTAGCAGAARLPGEQKRSVRGDRRHGRFYRHTGTVVPVPRSPGEGPPPGAAPPCTQLGGTRQVPGGGPGKAPRPIRGGG